MSASATRRPGAPRRRGTTTRLVVAFLAVVLVALVAGTVAGHAHPAVAGRSRGRPAHAEEILQHNLVVLVVVGVLALLSVGLLAVLYLLPSFWIVGFQVGQSWQQHGPGPTLHGLLWHAPLELTAFALCAATATVQSRRLWTAAGGRERGATRAAEVVGLLLRGWVASVGLLVLAALVEASLSAGPR